jgi:integrase
VGRTAEGWKLWQDGKTGRYSVRFRHEGARRSIALGTRDAGEAARKAPDVYADYVSGRWRTAVGVGARPQALDELVALWLDDYRAGRPGRTADACELHWRAHLLDAFGGDLARITRASIGDYQRQRLRVVTRSTLRKELSTLRVFIAWLVDTGRLAEEHAPAVPKLPRGALGTAHAQGRQKKRAELSPEEVNAIVCSLPLKTPSRRRGGEGWCRPYVEVLYETGLRPATVAALRCPEHWRPGAAHLDLPADLDKARMARQVPLSPRALAAIELVAAELPPGGGLLFGARDVRAALASACREWAIEPIKPYDLRHARGTHLLDAGAPLGAVGYLLGHARVTTTAIYARPSQRAAEAALRALGGIREVKKKPEGGAKGGT